jgi:hypothetical protein
MNAPLRETNGFESNSVTAESIIAPTPLQDESRIGFLGEFASASVERAFREQRFHDYRWLTGFLVTAGMLRVALLLLADYRDFDTGSSFWLLLAGRLLFLLVSAWVLFALRRAARPDGADRLFFLWGCLIVAMTVCALAARPPSTEGLLFMSFGMVLVTYCVTPLPLSRQATLALAYTAATFYACRQADSVTVAAVAAAHTMSHLFGAVMSFRLNHRRREMFLSAQRQAELRARLEAAVAEVKTLRGLLCICAWCKRVRDEAEAWEPVEVYVQNRSHALFSHGICPDCLEAEVKEVARLDCC